MVGCTTEDAACTDGSIPGDCNNGDGTVNPGEGELPLNGVDDERDGVVDSGTPDNDADGYDPILGGDCDDADPTGYPGAPELEDNIDNDCDVLVDEGTGWVDDDGDGYCEAVACGDGSFPDDCDDADSVVFPGAPELADWVDNNCDSTVDEGTASYDDDGDATPRSPRPLASRPSTTGPVATATTAIPGSTPVSVC